ncbi:hypothetical protein ABZP36_002902 [Zizania latifolia]
MRAPVTTTNSLLLHPPTAALRSLPSLLRPNLVARLGRRRGRTALLRCAAVSEVAPAASAVYGALLLGGGAFAYVRSGSKGSIYGGLSGSALMGIVSGRRIFPTFSEFPFSLFSAA